MRQHRDQRIAEVLIERIGRLAGNDGACIDIAGRLADQRVVIGCFHAAGGFWGGVIFAAAEARSP